MSRVAFGALLATFVAFAAAAMTPEIDTDGDGKASLTEVQFAYPDITSVIFNDMDLNADTFLDDEELITAVGMKVLLKKDAQL